MNKLSTADLEAAYDLIADGIDRAGEAQTRLFLAKLSFALADRLGDLRELRAAIDAALKDL
jgi:hypothetical protein